MWTARISAQRKSNLCAHRPCWRAPLRILTMDGKKDTEKPTSGRIWVLSAPTPQPDKSTTLTTMAASTMTQGSDPGTSLPPQEPKMSSS